MYKNDLPACLPIIACRQYGRVEPQGLNGSYSADQRQVCRVANYQLIGQVRISIFRYFVNPLPKYPKVSKDPPPGNWCQGGSGGLYQENV